MLRSRRLTRGLFVSALIAGVSGALPAEGGDAPEAAARIETTRSARTPRGATRVVFQLDRLAEHITVERPDGNGVEVHLLGVQPGGAPTEMKIADPRLDRVEFRYEPTGTVAEIFGSGSPITAKSFRLDNPPRIVVDFYPDEEDAGPGPEAARASRSPSPRPDDGPATIHLGGDDDDGEADDDAGVAGATGAGLAATVAAPKLVRKPYRTVQPEPTGRVEMAGAVGTGKDSAPTPADTDDDTDADDAAETTAPETEVASLFELAPSASLDAPDGDAAFDDLILWIHALKTRVEALRAVDSEIDRARLRRELAFLLAERGIYTEAEKALVSSLESEGQDETTAFADSLFLAELRVRLRRTDEASEVARSLDPTERRPAERHRLARVLYECGQIPPSVAVLEPVVTRLPEPDRSHANLLLARARWDQGDRKGAHALAQRLTESSATPGNVLSSALILQADCLWALGRMREAESAYRRAAGLRLSDEEASWTGLQLGNLARRAGREEEALRHYRDTSTNWPETFYGTQADWFLRVSEQIGRLRDEEVVRNRG